MEGSVQRPPNHSPLFLSLGSLTGILHSCHGTHQQVYPYIAGVAYIHLIHLSAVRGEGRGRGFLSCGLLDSHGDVPLPVDEKKRIQKNLTAIFSVRGVLCPHRPCHRPIAPTVYFHGNSVYYTCAAIFNMSASYAVSIETCPASLVSIYYPACNFIRLNTF